MLRSETRRYNGFHLTYAGFTGPFLYALRPRVAFAAFRFASRCRAADQSRHAGRAHAESRAQVPCAVPVGPARGGDSGARVASDSAARNPAVSRPGIG